MSASSILRESEKLRQTAGWSKFQSANERVFDSERGKLWVIRKKRLLFNPLMSASSILRAERPDYRQEGDNRFNPLMSASSILRESAIFGLWFQGFTAHFG